MRDRCDCTPQIPRRLNFFRTGYVGSRTGTWRKCRLLRCSTQPRRISEFEILHVDHLKLIPGNDLCCHDKLQPGGSTLWGQVYGVDYFNAGLERAEIQSICHLWRSLASQVGTRACRLHAVDPAIRRLVAALIPAQGTHFGIGT